MPIYYKKVNHNSSDALDLGESGRRFSFDFKSKLSSFNYRPRYSNDIDDVEHGILREDTESPLISSQLNGNQTFVSFEEGGRDRLMTKYGPIVTVKQGASDANAPVILTYHDIGLSYS